MAIAFNPSEEREGSHQTHGNSANSPPDPPPTLDSGNSSQSSSATSSTNSSPGAVTGPMPMPQVHQYAHHPNAAVYYYPGSPLVPPHSPVPPSNATIYRQYNNEELIQAICEALHRCSNGSLPPPSPSCNPYTPANVPLTPYAVYGQGGNGGAPSSSAPTGETNVFFPQNMPVTPHAYYSHQQPPHTPISHPSYYSQQPLYFQYHTIQPAYSSATPPTVTTPPHPTATTEVPTTISTPQPPRRAARRIRLSSRSEASPSTSVDSNPVESSESDADPVLCNEMNNYMTIVDANNNHHGHSASSDSDNPLHDHLTYLEARERLEEFPGRVPQRRKKSQSASSSSFSAKKAALVLPSDSDGASPMIITTQKQQNRQSNKSADSSGKDTSPLLMSEPGSSNSSSRRRSSSQRTSTERPKEQCMSWSLFTAFVLVVGCGYFASR